MRAPFAACTAALSGALVLAMTGVAVGADPGAPAASARPAGVPPGAAAAVPTTPSVPPGTNAPLTAPQAAATAPVRPGR